MAPDTQKAKADGKASASTMVRVEYLGSKGKSPRGKEYEINDIVVRKVRWAKYLGKFDRRAGRAVKLLPHPTKCVRVMPAKDAEVYEARDDFKVEKLTKGKVEAELEARAKLKLSVAGRL